MQNLAPNFKVRRYANQFIIDCYVELNKDTFVKIKNIYYCLIYTFITDLKQTV